MFSRAAPVVVEEIKNAEAIFGDYTRQHNPANAQENRAVTITVLALHSPVSRLTKGRITMLRKSILFLSLASIAAMIAWGFAPGGSTPVCASSSSAQNCALQITVNRPAFVGTAQNPQTASVTWNITNLPPCYQVTESEVTFTITRNNQPNVVIKRTVIGAATNVAVSLVNALGSNLAQGFQPNAIVAEVRVKVAAIDPNKTKTESNVLTL
jgi:hypothetical protein